MDNSIFASNLQDLLSMGFNDDIAIEALSTCSDLNSAIDYLFQRSSTISDPTELLYNPQKKQQLPPPPAKQIKPLPLPGPPLIPPPSKVIAPPVLNKNITPLPINSQLKPPLQGLSMPLLPGPKVGISPIQNPLGVPQPINPVQNPLGGPQLFSPQPSLIPPPGLSNNNPFLSNSNSNIPSFPSINNNVPSFPSSNQFNNVSSVPNIKNNISFFPNQSLANPPFQPLPPGPIYPPNLSVNPIQHNDLNTGPVIPNQNPKISYLNPLPFPNLNLNPPPLFPLQTQPDYSNESFQDFLMSKLLEKGFDEGSALEVTLGCSSKEEALLILDIPMSYKSKPFSEIASLIGSQDLHHVDEVITSLISAGVPKEKAIHYASISTSFPEALQFYYNDENTQKVPKFTPPTPPVSSLYLPKSQSVPKIPANPFVNEKKNIIPSIPPNLYNPGPSIYSINPGPSSLKHLKNNYYSKPVVLSAPSENDPVAPDIKTDYFEILKNHRLVLTEDPLVFQYFHLGNISSSGPQALKRINAEIKALQTSVPCDSSASIFTVIDSENMHRIKFLLSGTVDTPYAHGLYLFDVLLPAEYPNSPPLVNIITTGNGKMRFNPNLYSNGKVCLSIINTWSGNASEKWNPASSTLLQVMLSIQSLVMDNNILQKEPSFEGVPTNAVENIAYQQEVKFGNIRFAMIDMIKSPPKGFEEVVLKHFRAKKNEVINTVGNWVSEIQNLKVINNGSQNHLINGEINRKGAGVAFREAFEELRKLIDNI